MSANIEWSESCPVCNPPPKARTSSERLSVSIPAYLAAFARRKAKEDGVPISTIVNRALRHLRHQEAAAK